MEARLQNLGVAGASCTASAADRPTVGDNYKSDPEAVVNAQIDNIVHALACDRARVVSFTVAPENTGANGSTLKKVIPAWTGPGRSAWWRAHHVALQNQDPDSKVRSAAVKQMTGVTRWYAEKIKLLVDKLDAAGVFDDTLLVWGTAMSHAGYHTNRNPPFVIIQGSAGPLRTNRYLRWGNYTVSSTGDKKPGRLERQ